MLQLKLLIVYACLAYLIGQVPFHVQSASRNSIAPVSSSQPDQDPIVYGVSFSPDGRKLASASENKTVQLWDVTTGREIHTLTGHTRAVYKAVFSPDGKWLASSSRDRTIKTWDVTTGRESQTLAGHQHAVKSVVFNPDGKLLASASNDGTVKLWNAATGKEQHTFIHTTPAEDSSVYSVAFSPDGRFIASGNGDGTVSYWETATGRELRILKGHSRLVFGLSFNFDGRLLVSASWDKTVRLWDTTTGSEVRQLGGQKTEGLEERAMAAVFSPDGRWLAASEMGFDLARRQYTYNRIRIWEVASGREVRVLSGHTMDVNSLSFSSNGQKLASGSADNTIKIWDMKTGRELSTITISEKAKR